jgi:hypothetical protein
MNSRLAQTEGFLHPGQPRRRAAAVNPAADPTRPTKLDRGEHRHTIHSGGTHPSKINNRLHRKLDSLEVIAPGTEIHTDGALVLTRLSDHGFTHHPTPGYLASDLDAVVPGPHLVSSLLKRWTAGTLHHRISRQHLPYYLDEFTFRFNRRTSRARGLLFYRLLQQAAGTDPHPLSELIGGTGYNWDEPTDD